MCVLAAILNLRHPASAGFLGRPEARSLTQPRPRRNPLEEPMRSLLSPSQTSHLFSLQSGLQKPAQGIQEIYLLASGLRREPISLVSC